jgi:predicted metal-dependent phosphoesterase TrpH
MARADLHVHSTASDGSVEPADLPALAVKAGLAAMALTDHDSVEGVEAASRAAAAAGIELVPGVELTGYAPPHSGDAEMEVHITGLFVDMGSPVLLEKLRHLRAVRVERIKQMVEKLRTLGIEVEAAAVIGRSRGGAVGRVHLAEELVARGYCRSVAEAFDLYLGNRGPAYVPKERMTPLEAIALVHEAGGCAVLCHPGLLEDLDSYVEELAKSGLDAVEVHYPLHSPEDERRCMEIAGRLGLVVAGGSDFHGVAKPDVHIGQEAVSYIELEELRRRAGRRE